MNLKIANPAFEARNGVKALERLRGQNGFDKVPPPYLVLLDLNMPRLGGIEFLKELRDDPDLHRTLVFVMTTIAAEEDRLRAYDMNVAGYVLKHQSGQTFPRFDQHAGALLARSRVSRVVLKVHGGVSRLPAESKN